MVSRAIQAHEDWVDELQEVFGLLNTYFDIWITDECAMHVHISLVGPGPLLGGRYPNAQYTDEDIQKRALAAFYWESAYERTMPPERKKTPWAQPNIDVIPWAQSAYRAIEAGRAHWSSLGGELWGRSKERVIAKMHGKKPVSGAGDPRYPFERYQSTNFNNVLEACGTIEERRFPGIKDPVTAASWIAYALGLKAYILYQMDFPTVFGETGFQSSDTLRRAINSGIRLLPPNCYSWGFNVSRACRDRQGPPKRWS